MVPLRSTRAEVDLGAIVANYLAIRRQVGCEVLPVVKADAYGHGAVEVCRALASHGAPLFAVAILQEAVALRDAGIRQPILVFGCLLPEEIGAALEYGLIPQISDLEFARRLSQEATRCGRTVPVHLHVDTGMGRSGVSAAEAVEAASALNALPGLVLEGLMTHFPSSDEEAGTAFTREQAASFVRICEAIENRGIRVRYRHTANSGAILGHRVSWLDLVRPGMILYGCYPSNEVERSVPLRQAMTLKTRLVLIKNVPKGHSISYGRTFVAPRDMRIGLLPLGYDDGLDRRLSNLGQVLVHGRRVPIVGRVCMDQTLVDLTDLSQPAVGDEAVIYGAQGKEQILIHDVAASIDTIPQTLVCAVSRRVPRVYLPAS